jgi:hypothetical protein
MYVLCTWIIAIKIQAWKESLKEEAYTWWSFKTKDEETVSEAVDKTFWPEGCGDCKLGQRARARRELGKENWRQPGLRQPPKLCGKGRKRTQEIGDESQKTNDSRGTVCSPPFHHLWTSSKCWEQWNFIPLTKLWGGRLCHYLDHIIWHNIAVMMVYPYPIVVIRISVEHDFLRKLLNLPSQTLMSWNGLTLTHYVGCITKELDHSMLRSL